MDSDTLIKVVSNLGNAGVLLVVAWWAFRKDGPVAALNGILTGMHGSLTRVETKLDEGVRVASELREDHQEMRDKFSRIEGKLRVGSDPNVQKVEGR